MTLDDVRAAMQEGVLGAERLIAHMSRLQARLAADFPIDARRLAAWSDEESERVDSFLRKFEQLYDLIGRTVMRGFVTLSGEDAAALSMRNLARRVEALGGIGSADRWFELGGTRNRLAHDYPLHAAAEADTANLAWSEAPTLLREAGALIQRFREDDL